MLSTLMLQNLPDWWLTRDLVAWLGCVRCLAFCVFEGNLAGNFWVGVRCLPAAGGFKTIQKDGRRSPPPFWIVLLPPGVSQTPKTGPTIHGQTAFRYSGIVRLCRDHSDYEAKECLKNRNLAFSGPSGPSGPGGSGETSRMVGDRGASSPPGGDSFLVSRGCPGQAPKTCDFLYFKFPFASEGRLWLRKRSVRGSRQSGYSGRVGCFHRGHSYACVWGWHLQGKPD